MTSLAVEQELLHSCEVLFGSEINLSREFLEYLQHSGVKTAYRQKVKEVHPDVMPGVSNFNRITLIDVFQSVQKAYENLILYVDAREKGYCFPSVGKSHPSAGKTASAEEKIFRQSRASTLRKQDEFMNSHKGEYDLYRGSLPRRQLLFGRFLYYSGVISWNGIINALVWQRAQRPQIGELGVKFGWLKDHDIPRIIDHSTPLQPFGKSAVKLGILTAQQRETLLFQQKCLKKKLGQFFIESGFMSTVRLNYHLERFRLHNIGLK